MIDKEFRTYEMQIKILKDRGIEISDEYNAYKILEKENYYNLINGYKDLFLDQNSFDNKYIKGTNLDEIVSLFEFDRELKVIFFKRMLRLENNFRSVIAYEFSKKYGHSDYLKVESFNDLKQTSAGEEKLEKRNKEITELIEGIEKDIKYNSNKRGYIQHYLKKHGYIPLWVLVNAISLGTLSKFYYLMKDSEKVSVAKKFNISYSLLGQYIKVLAVHRNICAHDERFYCIRLDHYGYDIGDTIYHEKFNIPKINEYYTSGKKDLFAVVIIMKKLLNTEEFHEFIEDIKKQVEELKNCLNTVSIDQVLERMGFPKNWFKINNM